MRALAAGGIYVSVLFAIGFLLGPLRVFLLEPVIGPFRAVLVEAPFLTVAMVLTAPRAADWMRLPPGRWHSLAMGAVAAGWMLAFEMVAARLFRGLSPLDYLRSQLNAAGYLGFALILLLALVPLARRAAR